MKKLLFGLPVLLLLLHCTPSPKPIEYGADKCEFCRMTIVDRQHAAELMTAKGRVHKFDAIECMLNMINQEQEGSYQDYLVTDFSGKGALVDATVCTYLISEQMPSPMGAFLSAFQSPELAAEFQKSKGGELFSWKAINQKYNNTLQ